MKNKLLFKAALLFGCFLFTTCTTETTAMKKEQFLELKSNQLSFKVDPNIGGRVASFQLNGQEVLFTKRDSANLKWGSTIWPSPQADWSWPPPKGMDRMPYKVIQQTDKQITLESAPNAYKDIQVTKQFTLLSEQTIGLSYTFTNKGDTSIQVGIWENSRIPFAGEIQWKTFTPIKDTIPGLDQSQPISSLKLGAQQAPRKLFINSPDGQITYRNEGLIWIKQFKASPQEVAPEQATIELYYESDDKFAEIEAQGPYVRLQPGEKTTFSVEWFLKKEGNN